MSSQLAQTGDDIAVNRPPTYAYDLMLLGVITAGLGLFGMPPVSPETTHPFDLPPTLFSIC